MGETSDVTLCCRTPRSGGLIEKPMGTMPEPCRPFADASIRASVPHTIGFDGNHRLLMPRLRQLLAGLGQPRIKYARLQRNYPADRHAGCCRMPNEREGRRRGVSPARTAMRTGRNRSRARLWRGGYLHVRHVSHRSRHRCDHHPVRRRFHLLHAHVKRGQPHAAQRTP